MPQPVVVAALSILVAAPVLGTTAESNMTPESAYNAAIVVPAPCRGERLPALVRPAGLTPRLPARPMWLWDSPKVLRCCARPTRPG
jgi:hypothetical protein